jgi:Family of unknown function (DUF6278)
MARGVVVYGVPRGPEPDRLDELLSRCDRLRSWARVRGGFVLSGVPEDLELLDQAIDEWHHDGQTATLANEAGLFLGTVIIASIPGARWQLWPNGHPVLRLASGREVDAVALGGDRVSKGGPRLTRVFADAAADRRV